ncbi:MAG TPA: peroxidase family protein, partial [Thermoanaerobaculia bacterium]
SLLFGGCVSPKKDLEDCAKLVKSGFRPVAKERSRRFLGKVEEKTARCRGGEKAVAHRSEPWVDWQHYWGTSDEASVPSDGERFGHLGPKGRGVDGAMLDLEYQRLELVKFNLFDNTGTYKDYVTGRAGVGGPALKIWPEMRLPKDHPNYVEVGGDGDQLCQGELIRFRTVTGICNDLRNPAMGSAGMLFARNVTFESTFPDLGKNELAKNRHGDRLGVLTPDPQLISRKLFTRVQSQPDKCNAGQGLPGFSADANCDYQKAPFFNVLAAFWIQFMTHDWFSHMTEGHNAEQRTAMGCSTKKVNGVEVPLTPEEIARLGCRPGDRIDRAVIAEDGEPAKFKSGNQEHLSRAYRTTRNTNTAWWDGSQIYGYDETSRKRVKRDPKDGAKLHMVPVGNRPGEGEKLGYLPLLQPGDPMHPQWAGQEATGFPENFTIGMSFYHNVFAREHNLFVDEIRKRQRETPDADSGLRNPARPQQVIAYKDLTDDEIFEAGRLVVSAVIAKIHTIEWTPQLLYDEPLFLAMNANWNGLFHGSGAVEKALNKVLQDLGRSKDPRDATQWYSVFASGPGIFGLGSHVYEKANSFKFDPRKKDVWSVTNPDHVNGGINHFGSPFNFPEEFITVYRLHPLVPDLIEYRDWNDNPNVIRNKIPTIETFRGKATKAMQERGLANWALSMGRQRLGALTLQNHGQFLQNVPMPRMGENAKVDVAALDILRDRERGVPRFNEFRRQYGLKQLTSFDDFVDKKLDEKDPELARQRELVKTLREVYGQHKCDASKVITDAQVNDDGTPINDCLGRPDGSLVDNIEDVDTVVGWLAEFTRPHGFAISETQFQVFILNASRRLFSDRFFTSSFRPEFYTSLGVDWVNDNGPDGKVMEKGKPNGHPMEVSPLKRVLMRTLPELKPELEYVTNAFDPWARDRGKYYSLAWKPRPGAESDVAFAPTQQDAVPASGGGGGSPEK